MSVTHQAVCAECTQYLIPTFICADCREDVCEHNARSNPTSVTMDDVALCPWCYEKRSTTTQEADHARSAHY